MARARATTARKALRFEASDIQIRGHVLSRLAKELSGVQVGAADDFDTHIKNKCDLHGKGSHIKGSGPNYLKGSTSLGFEDVINPALAKLPLSRFTGGQLAELMISKPFIEAIASRVAERVRGL